MKLFSMKKTKLSESKYSKVSKMTEETSHKRNQFTTNNSLKDIRSLVFRSLELDTNSVFNDSSNSSEVLSDSTISDSGKPVNKKEAIDLVPSSYESNLSSSFSISMPYIFNQSDLKCSVKSVDYSLSDWELENTQDDDNEVFTSMKNNSLNLFEIENLDNDENSKKALFSVIDEYKTTSPFNLFSRGKTLNSEANVFNPKLLKSNKNEHFCPHCLKSFGIPSRLKKHIKTHRIKPEDSEIDDEMTSLGSVSINDTSVELDSEMRKKCQNIQQRQKDVQCPNCLKSFNCPSKLLRHTKTHVGLKPYTCHFVLKSILREVQFNFSYENS